MTKHFNAFLNLSCHVYLSWHALPILLFIFYPIIVHQGFWYFYSGQNSTAYFDTTAASFGGSKAASKPVRLYCDICEEFDKHDTDDCPLQEGDGGSNYAVKNDKWDPNSYDDDDETF